MKFNVINMFSLFCAIQTEKIHTCGKKDKKIEKNGKQKMMKSPLRFWELLLQIGHGKAFKIDGTIYTPEEDPV